MTIRILVADDSIAIQKIVTMAFENEDAEVEGIGDGQEAFDKVQDFKPDIVLADVDMPGLDGFELCQKIKGNPELANIKILLLASDFEDFDEGRFKECQAENHISKPFKSDDIVQMVTQVMTGESAVETAVLPDGVEEKDDEPSLEELLESVERLATDSMEMTDDEGIPRPAELVESVEEEPVLEDHGSFAEDLEVYAEVRPQKMESFDDLDSAFKKIVSGDAKQPVEIKEAGISVLESIVPEPEDLLEKMAPGAFSEAERRPHSPEEIWDNLSNDPSSLESTRYQNSPKYENSDDRFLQVAGEQVRQILEKSLDSSLQKEMSVLSDILVKTIREVVREITPEIARSIIQEEIEKIKKI